MMYELIINLIQAVGFPIAITVFLLVRSAKKEEKFMLQFYQTLERIEKNLLILNISVGKLLNGDESEFKKIIAEISAIELQKLKEKQ